MKILIADDMHQVILDILGNAGHTLLYMPEITKKEFLEISNDIDGLVLRSRFFVDEELLKNAENLKFIGRAGAGIDNLDVSYLESRNIKIFNAPEGNRDAVGDHTLGLILNLTNNLKKSHHEIALGKWDREGNRGIELSELTVGIIGYGNTGRAVAKRLKAFNTKVLAYDKYQCNFSDQFAEETTLEKIFAEVDLLTFHIPLTRETDRLVNKQFLENFKKQIFLINVSRGEIIDHEALKNALIKEKVRGIGLDVFENEKLQHLTTEQNKRLQFFLHHPNCIITPHVGGWSFASYFKISKVLGEKILNFI